jgi:hypothetical protein
MTKLTKLTFVIPVKTGIQKKIKNWIPAFAGMTVIKNSAMLKGIS